MLPRPNRLPGYRTSQVLSSKTTLHSPFFGLKVSPSDQPLTRIGFIISSKIAKRAVDRNRLKRLLRKAIRPHLQNLKPKHDLLFLAKHPLKTKTLDQIKPHILTALKKAKLLNEKPSS